MCADLAKRSSDSYLHYRRTGVFVSLHHRTYPNQGTTGVRLLTCPLLVDGGPDRCGYEFTDHESRWKHYHDEHTPVDAGLSPLGDRQTHAKTIHLEGI